MADGTVWQGESLQYDGTPEGDVQIVMLQQAQAGGETALRLEGAHRCRYRRLSWPARICRWRQPLYSAHPSIQFVRARQSERWRMDL